MKDFAKGFYLSQAWKDARKAYAKSVGNLCEECAKSGKITLGEIVHHRQHLTPNNIHDPAVTLSWSNLQLLCRECHAKAHGAKQHRFRVDSFGRVTA